MLFAFLAWSLQFQYVDVCVFLNGKRRFVGMDAKIVTTTEINRKKIVRICNESLPMISQSIKNTMAMTADNSNSSISSKPNQD